MKRYLLSFFMFSMMMPMLAQNISVQSFRLAEDDQSANTAGAIVYDQNANKCALIKVMTPYKDFYFDAAELDSPLAILRLSAMIRQGEIDLDEEDADYLLASVIENHKDTVDDLLRFYRERKAMKNKESQSKKTE